VKVIKAKKFYIGLTDRVFKTLLFGTNTERTKWFVEKCLNTKITNYKLNKTYFTVNSINSKEKVSDVVVTINDVIKVCFEANRGYKRSKQVKNYSYISGIYSYMTERGEEYNTNKKCILIDITSGLPSYFKRDIDTYRPRNIKDSSDDYVQNFVIKRYNIDKIKKYMYTLDKEKINKYCHLIMLVLEKGELIEFMDNKYLSQENKEQVKQYGSDLIDMNEEGIDLIDYVGRDEKWARREAYEDGHEDGVSTGITIGEERGRSEGITIGEEKAEIAMTEKMLKDGMSPNIIKKYVKLSMEKINQIQTSMFL